MILYYRAEGVKESKDREGGSKVSQGSSHTHHAQGHAHAPGHGHGPDHAHAPGHAQQGSRTKSPLKETSQVNVATKDNAEEGEERKLNR